MSTAQGDGLPGRLPGLGGLTLAIGGGVAILAAGGNITVSIAVTAPLLLALILALLPATRDNSLTWLVTGIWCALFGIVSIFSVGIIFLVASIFLLGAFLRANWAHIGG